MAHFWFFLIPNIILQVTNLTFWLAFTVFKIWALIFFTSKFQLLTAHESYHLNVKLLNLWPPGLVCYFLESQDINSIHLLIPLPLVTSFGCTCRSHSVSLAGNLFSFTESHLSELSFYLFYSVSIPTPNLTLPMNLVSWHVHISDEF